MSGATETVLLFTCSPSFVARLHLESLAAAISEVINRSGATAFAQWRKRTLRIRIQAFAEEPLTEVLDSFVAYAAQGAFDLELIRTVVPATKLPDPSGPIPWGSVLSGALSPRLLRRLPEGCAVVTSVPHDNGMILRAEMVGPLESRAALWRRLTRGKAGSRSWRVVWHEVDLGGAADANGCALRISERPDRH